MKNAPPLSQKPRTSKAERMYELAARDGGWLCFYCERQLATADESIGWEWVDEIEAGEGRCCCGKHTDGERCVFPAGWVLAPGYLFPSIDHVVPRARGGAVALENEVLACKGCNSAKRDREAEAYIR